MLVLGLGAAVWYGVRKQFTEVLTIVGWGHLALIIVRNMPIFMIAAAPVVALPLVEWLKALSGAPIAGWMRRIFAAPETIGEEIAPHGAAVAHARDSGGDHGAAGCRYAVAEPGKEAQAGVRSGAVSLPRLWLCCSSLASGFSRMTSGAIICSTICGPRA